MGRVNMGRLEAFTIVPTLLYMADRRAEQGRTILLCYGCLLYTSLNLLVDATPDATMKIIMDPIAGDYISGRGTGNIRTEFFHNGDVKMFGSYRISQGVYKFSLQEVIRKDFIIRCV